MDYIEQLKYWLSPIEQIFADLDGFVLDPDDKDKRRIFIDNNADVLFVAHLDTVQPPQFKYKTQKRIYASGLDDRLGAMIAFNLAEELGADLLLTDHEEAMKSTAQFHHCKDYNWIAEFDRAGNDVVTYDLDCVGFRNALKAYWQIGFGAFSDICQLKTSACCVNIGIGYQLAHSIDSYVDINVVKSQVAEFKIFFAEHKDVKYERDFSAIQWYRKRGSYTYSSINGLDEEVCDICGEYGAEKIHGYWVCADCLTAMIEQYTWTENDIEPIH